MCDTIPICASVGCNDLGEPAQHEGMGAADIFQLGPQLVAEHDRVHEAAGPGDDGRAAAGAPQDRNASLAARRLVHFLLDARRAADDDHRLRRLPQSQEFPFRVLVFCLFQQRLVEGEVLGGRRQREFQALHGSVVSQDGDVGKVGATPPRTRTHSVDDIVFGTTHWTLNS